MRPRMTCLQNPARVATDPIHIQSAERLSHDKFHLNASSLDLAFEHLQGTLNNLERLRVDRCDLFCMLARHAEGSLVYIPSTSHCRV
jgi:hypothetical protein